ncbi:MAG: hypothetical protein D6725_11770, partial [Planctomycetota bacterium]
DVVSGKIASVDIDRRDSVVSHPQAPEDAAIASPSAAPKTADDLDDASIEILCDNCGGNLASDGSCPHCGARPPQAAPPPRPVRRSTATHATPTTPTPTPAGQTVASGGGTGATPLPPLPDDDAIIEVVDLPAQPTVPASAEAAHPPPHTPTARGTKKKPKLKPPPLPPMLQGPKNPQIEEEVEKGAEEFWGMED